MGREKRKLKKGKGRVVVGKAADYTLTGFLHLSKYMHSATESCKLYAGLYR
jgi:hypothetical protein